MNNTNDSTLPLPDSYWVIKGSFLAGEYPGRRDENETRHRAMRLLECGIRVCIDLTKPGEIVPSYRDIFLQELDLYGYQGNYFHFPVYDFGIPDEKQMHRTLDQIDKCIEEKLPVYLHCRAGIGRTGLTVGCYLVRHGLTGDDALNRIKELRKEVASSWAASPETDAQVEYIRKWTIGK
jgi:hypothetical protein